MLKYILRRILQMIPTTLLVILISYILLSFLPSSPGRIILGNNASEEEVERVDEELGYHDPVLVQYGKYLLHAVQGDFGDSYTYGRPVFEILLPKFPTTAKLAVLATLVAVIIGVPIGVLSAIKQYSLADRFTTVLSLLAASIPSFFFGVLMILLFSLKLGWLPSNGLGTWKNYVMPVMTLALPFAGMFSRLSRTMMLETMQEDYIYTARVKGCSKLRIIFCHALKNALMPVITQLGMSVAGLLGGSILVEQVFGLPGFGSLILNATQSKDIPMIMGSTLFLSVIFMVIMLIVDVVYALLDPRIAEQG